MARAQVPWIQSFRLFRVLGEFSRSTALYYASDLAILLPYYFIGYASILAFLLTSYFIGYASVLALASIWIFT